MEKWGRLVAEVPTYKEDEEESSLCAKETIQPKNFILIL
jgi:hypothetical protein